MSNVFRNILLDGKMNLQKKSVIYQTGIIYFTVNDFHMSYILVKKFPFLEQSEN